MARMGSFSTNGLKELKKQLENLQPPNAFAEECASELAALLLRKVKMRTPVGQPPKLDGPSSIKVKVKGTDGRSRHKAFLTKKGEILQKYWAGHKGGNLRRSWTVGEVKKIGGGYVIEVINLSIYASYVEYGHRQKPGRYIPALGKRTKTAWVRGRFMMTISEQEVKAMAEGILNGRMRRYLSEVLK